jgi:predicted nucleotidyltransferase component of viral defense system
MINNWIESYKPKNIEETEQALREIMQEITLAGLYRANFFQHAAFYGGTALRIFHGLKRFSEDLDFSLLKKNSNFDITPYFHNISEEFRALGLTVTLTHKSKTIDTNIDSAFLKSDTIWSEIILENSNFSLNLIRKPVIKIKLEIDKNPPLGFETENLLLLRPFSFQVNCMKLPDLYAGKMHALLFRKWKTRVKGRDWFDFEWYVQNNVPLNLEHFRMRAIESGDFDSDNIGEGDFKEMLMNRISQIQIEGIKLDISRFIQDQNVLNIWSTDYFNELVKKMRFL